MDQIYKYRAVDTKGRLVTGNAVAATQEEVLSIIRSKDQKPIQVEAGGRSSTNVRLGSKRLSLKDTILFCRQACTMLNAGLTLTRALDVLIAQATSKKMRAVLLEISESVQKGESLSVALNMQGDTFPALMRKTIEAGEMTGQLAEVMEKMAIHYEKEKKIKSKIKNAMMYPIILSTVAIGAMVILLTFVMPKFMESFAASGVEFPALTRMVMAASRFLVSNGIVIALLITALVTGYNVAVKRSRPFRTLVDRIKVQFFLIKGPMAKIITSRFTSTLSTLLSSGISVVQALETAGQTTQNFYVEDKVREAIEGISKGMGLSNQLGKSEVFPPMMLSMIGIGEESGNLESMLKKTSDYYDEELEAALQQMVSILEPAMILVMGVLIGIVVISMYLPMFDMFKTLS